MLKKWNNLGLFMKGNRSRYLLAFIFAATAAAFAYMGPLILRFAVDGVLDNQYDNFPVWLRHMANLFEREAALILCGAAIIFSALIGGLFSYFKGKLASKASEGTAKKLRERVYGHLQDLSFAYHSKSDSGDIYQRCTSDIETIRFFLEVQLVETGRMTALVFGGIIILFNLNLKLTFFAVLLIPVIFLFTIIFFFRMKKRFTLVEETEAKMSAVLQENLAGVHVVKAFAKQSFESERFDRANKAHAKSGYHMLKLLALFYSISDGLSFMQIAIVLIAGSVLAIGGEISIGTLLVFLSFEGMILWPLREFGRTVTEMGKAFVSVSRLMEILSQPGEDYLDDGIKPQIEGDINFENIHFSYEGNSVLKDINLTVKKGMTVAITGTTGSGKTTLMNLLLRLYEPDKGTVRTNGYNIARVNKKWLRQNIAYILQESFLFAKTIEDNIRITSEEAEEKELHQAALTANVHHTIMDFEKGYGTFVGEKGVTLSGGQKQRVAIARALIRKSPILVFDDSLSAVDTETENIILKELLKQKATTFIISHRISTIEKADIIFVMDKGRIVGQGSHNLLIREEGIYKQMWLKQFNHSPGDPEVLLPA